MQHYIKHKKPYKNDHTEYNMVKSQVKPKKLITLNKTKHKPLVTLFNLKKNRNNNKPIKNSLQPPHIWTPHEKLTTGRI